MIGRTVGRYHIVGKLGEGGMGTVWKAKDTLLGRTVAIKFLPESVATSPDARRRFIRGARAAAELDHPGIAAIYDAGEAEGMLYIAGALVDGVTVSEKVARGALPLGEAVRIGCEAAAALHHAHTRGVLHRDISGSNLMVHGDGRVAVLDFGLAKAMKDTASPRTKTGVAIGTAAYMAPEVAVGRAADARADIYALGAVIYEMATGSPPFVADRPEALLYRAVHEPVEPASRRRRGLPAAIDRILLKALAKDPAQRYPSAEALLADLRSLAGKPSRARPGRGRARPTGIAWMRAPAGRPRGTRAPRRTRPATLPEAKILAVLPFRELEPDARQGSGVHVLACGLAETVSVRLARVRGLQVIPPLAVSALPSRVSDTRGLARSLGASLVLNGSVQRARRRLRVTFSLVRGEDGVQVAGDTVDGGARDLLALEDRLVRSVLRALEVESSARLPGRPGPADPAAREHYLQALGYLQRYENEASIDGAVGLLERMVEGGEDTAQVQAALGRAYLCKYRLTLERAWQERARRACARALDLDTESPDVLLTLGQLHNAVGRYAAAARVLRHALRLSGGDLEAMLALAVAYDGAGRVDEAETTLREAIALRPTSWAGYNRLGALYFKLGRYEEAVQLFRRVIEITPDNARGHTNLASAYYHLGRWNDASTSYRRSLEIHPNASAYTSLGTVQFFMGHYDRAAAAFEKGAALRPFDHWQWGNLADAYRWIPGKEEKAVTAFEQAIRLVREQLEVNPHHGKYWAELAAWLAKRGRSREAIRAIRSGLRFAPRDVSVMVNAMVVHELVGDRKKALARLVQLAAHGYNPVELERDPELASLRQDPGFRKILKEKQAV